MAIPRPSKRAATGGIYQGMGIPVSEIGTEKPLDFHSFSKQKMTYSPAWKTMSLDARELRYEEYLQQFSRKLKAPTSSQQMDCEAFGANRKNTINCGLGSRAQSVAQNMTSTFELLAKRPYKRGQSELPKQMRKRLKGGPLMKF